MRIALPAAVSFAALLLGGCTTVGGPGASSYFDCGDGKMLKATFSRQRAMMQVDNGPLISLKATPAVRGQIYEGGAGLRLAVDGDVATWSGRTREAPATCRRVAVPR